MPALASAIRSNPRHKVSVRLSPDAFSTAQEAVELGISPNQNSFIEEAIRLRSREVRHARMRIQAAAAMSDRGFVEDMRETMQAFESADRDGWLTEPLAKTTER
jgi:Arc/MetJ-type ribon-helix-helix transcriptional regulator